MLCSTISLLMAYIYGAFDCCTLALVVDQNFFAIRKVLSNFIMRVVLNSQTLIFKCNFSMKLKGMIFYITISLIYLLAQKR